MMKPEDWQKLIDEVWDSAIFEEMRRGESEHIESVLDELRLAVVGEDCPDHVRQAVVELFTTLAAVGAVHPALAPTDSERGAIAAAATVVAVRLKDMTADYERAGFVSLVGILGYILGYYRAGH